MTKDELLHAVVEEQRKRLFASLPPMVEEQKHAMQLALDGVNMFYTGAAGSGKTTGLLHIIKAMRELGTKVAVTGSTGQAANLITGTTLHNFMGFGIMAKKAFEMYRERFGTYGSVYKKYFGARADNAANKKKRVPFFALQQRERIKDTRVLILDEISMISAEVLDRVDMLLRLVRDVDTPFGGMQVIFVGDFYQLPPVIDQRASASHETKRVRLDPEDAYAFKAKSWKDARLFEVCLTTQHRQSGDDVFMALLERAKHARLTEDDFALLRTRVGKWTPDVPLPVPHMLSRNDAVDRVNARRMAQLDKPPVVFEAHEFTQQGDKGAEFVLKGLSYQKRFELREGAPVMLRCNIDVELGLTNGACGVVAGFEFNSIADRRAYDAGKRILVRVDLSTTFKHKCHAREGVKQGELVSGAHCDEMGCRLVSAATTPVQVRIAFENKGVHVIDAQVASETVNKKVRAARAQVPLLAAFALTVHKAQGSTMRRARMDLGSVMQNGQAYVALSRATALESLFLDGLSRYAFSVSSAVEAYMDGRRDRNYERFGRPEADPQSAEKDAVERAAKRAAVEAEEERQRVFLGDDLSSESDQEIDC